ncbi:hypothetical protein AAMO2058_000439600 [Amorphochlora amoebiformis]
MAYALVSLVLLVGYLRRIYMQGDIGATVLDMMDMGYTKQFGFQKRFANSTGPLAKVYFLDNLYNVKSDLPPLVLIHGFNMRAPQMATYFYPLFTHRNRRVIIIGLLDYALTHHSTFDVIGVSLGGALTSYMFHKIPHRIRKAILIAPTSFELIDMDFTKYAFECLKTRRMGFHTIQTMRHYYKTVLGMHDNAMPPSFILRGIQKRCNNGIPKNYWTDFFKAVFVEARIGDENFRHILFSNPSAFKGYDVEIVLIVGERDKLTSFAKCRQFKEFTGNRVSMYVVKDSGHLGPQREACGVDNLYTEVCGMVYAVITSIGGKEIPRSFKTKSGAVISRVRTT